jgi:hypothetical protein
MALRKKKKKQQQNDSESTVKQQQNDSKAATKQQQNHTNKNVNNEKKETSVFVDVAEKEDEELRLSMLRKAKEDASAAWQKEKDSEKKSEKEFSKAKNSLNSLNSALEKAGLPINCNYFISLQDEGIEAMALGQYMAPVMIKNQIAKSKIELPDMQKAFLSSIKGDIDKKLFKFLLENKGGGQYIVKRYINGQADEMYIAKKLEDFFN